MTPEQRVRARKIIDWRIDALDDEANDHAKTHSDVANDCAADADALRAVLALIDADEAGEAEQTYYRDETPRWETGKDGGS